MFKKWHFWTFAGLLLVAILIVEQDMSDPIPRYLRGMMHDGEKTAPKELTEDQRNEIARYPKSEREYWEQEMHRGNSLPEAPQLAKYCALNPCGHFPIGYHSVEVSGKWLYFPLDWPNQQEPEFPKLPEPRFYLYDNEKYEERDHSGLIVKRVSFARTIQYLWLNPFVSHYESEFEEKFKTTHVRISRGHWDVGGYTNLSISPSAAELAEVGLKEYDENFWLIKEGEGPWGFYHIKLVSKQPVFQGRRAYVDCAKSCDISPIAEWGTKELLFRVDGGFWDRDGTVFHVNYDHEYDADEFKRELEKNNFYSLGQHGSQHLMDYIEMADRIISRLQSPDPELVQQYHG